MADPPDYAKRCHVVIFLNLSNQHFSLSTTKYTVAIVVQSSQP